MKRKIKIIFTLIMVISLALCFVTAYADGGEEQESVVTLDDIVVATNGGEVAFKKIDPYFNEYNINRHSDSIDTKGTIDEVLVLSTESANTVFTFKTHLNSDYLTKYYNIIEWFIVPTHLQTFKNDGIEGVADTDFETFEITIKDVNNPDKYVVFRTMNSPDSTTYRNVVSGRVGANGQSIEGYNATFMEINRNWGTRLKASHVGCFNANDGVPDGYDPFAPLGGFLSLDYSEKIVYSVTGSNKGERLMVRDLDEGTHMIGTDIPWAGFDSKELEVSIRFANITSGRKASVAILGFNGVDFTKGEIIDGTAPKVIQKTSLDGKLFGEVGRAMPVMDFYAYDTLDGFIDETSSKVYFNYNKASQIEYQIIDGRFTPERAGVYSIVTTATDRLGNVGKVVTEVDIKHVIPEVELSFAEQIANWCIVGETVTLPQPIIYGGTINKNYRIEVLRGNENVEIKENSFCATKQGIYVIRYVVWDYYGQEMNFDYFLNATLGDKPIVEFPEIPENAIVGNKMVIPSFTALDYITYGDVVNATVKYQIKTPSSSEYSPLENDYFVPQEEGEYKLKITVAQVGDASNTLEKEYTVNCKNCNLVSDYFILEDTSLVEYGYNFGFITTEETGSISFINTISNKNLQFEFNLYDILIDAKVTIRLYDSANRSNFVDLKLQYENTRESLLTIGNKSFVVNGAIFDRNELSNMSEEQADGLKAATIYNLSYNEGWIYDGTTSLCKLEKFENGKAFDEFASGKVYFEMIIESVSGQTAVEFSNFCGNKDFDLYATDITTPTISFSSISRIAKIGDIVSMNYSANDLFDVECSITVTITKNGKLVAEGKDGNCTFIVTEFGTHVVVILAVDREGNETSIKFNIECFDTVAPTITVADNLKSKLKLGKSLKLPTATITDNIDEELKYSIFAKTPGNSYAIITDHTFTPDEKGLWTIYYYVEDSSGNSSVQTFYINVV